jgi:hypothetical protein
MSSIPGEVRNRQASLEKLEGLGLSGDRFLTADKEGHLGTTRDSGVRGGFSPYIPEEKKKAHQAAITAYLHAIRESMGSVGAHHAWSRLERHFVAGKPLTARDARIIALEARALFVKAQADNQWLLATTPYQGKPPFMQAELEALTAVNDLKLDHRERDALVSRAVNGVAGDLKKAGQALTKDEMRGLLREALTREHNLIAVERAYDAEASRMQRDFPRSRDFEPEKRDDRIQEAKRPSPGCPRAR